MSERKQIEGQGALFSSFEAPSDDDRDDSTYQKEVLIRSAINLITNSKEEIKNGDDQSLLFIRFTTKGSPDAVRRIANQEDFRDYTKGARQRVVDSSKWIAGGPDHQSYAELRDKADRLPQELGAATANSDLRVRKIIAKNIVRTDIEKLSDKDTDRPGLLARLSYARSSGGVEFGPFDFANNIRESAQAEKYQAELQDLALELDDMFVHDGLDSNISAILTDAIHAGRQNGDAARFIFALGELYEANVRAQQPIWQAALDRYNTQYPNNPINPIVELHIKK